MIFKRPTLSQESTESDAVRERHARHVAFRCTWRHTARGWYFSYRVAAEAARAAAWRLWPGGAVSPTNGDPDQRRNWRVHIGEARSREAAGETGDSWEMAFMHASAASEQPQEHIVCSSSEQDIGVQGCPRHPRHSPISWAPREASFATMSKRTEQTDSAHQVVINIAAGVPWSNNSDTVAVSTSTVSAGELRAVGCQEDLRFQFRQSVESKENAMMKHEAAAGNHCGNKGEVNILDQVQALDLEPAVSTSLDPDLQPRIQSESKVEVNMKMSSPAAIHKQIAVNEAMLSVFLFCSCHPGGYLDSLKNSIYQALIRSSAASVWFTR